MVGGRGIDSRIGLRPDGLRQLSVNHTYYVVPPYREFHCEVHGGRAGPAEVHTPGSPRSEERVCFSKLYRLANKAFKTVQASQTEAARR